MIPENLRTTKDHEEIKRWAEEHNGRPAVTRHETRAGGVGIIGIDLADFGEDEYVQRISWEDFFEQFDERRLAFVYEEETRPGEKHWFHKLTRLDGRP